MLNSSFPPPRLGLALSGGGALGAAHIGVLKALMNAGVPIDAIAGTSVGSMVGALYAGGALLDDVQKAARSSSWLQIVSPLPSRLGILSNRRLKKFIIKQIGDVEFKDLKIPLRVVATDLEHGREVWLEDGSVAAAICASCALPWVFKPVEWQGKLLGDGGLLNNLPVNALEDWGVKVKVAVDLMPPLGVAVKPKNPVQLVRRAFNLMLSNANLVLAQQADVVIRPDLGKFSPLDLSKVDLLVAAGQKAGEEALESIVKLLKSHE